MHENVIYYTNIATIIKNKSQLKKKWFLLFKSYTDLGGPFMVTNGNSILFGDNIQYCNASCH